MKALKFALTALASTALLATAARAESVTEANETVMTSPGYPSMTSEVCVRNTLDRALGVSTTWAVGDEWNTMVIGAGDAVLFRLVQNAGPSLHPKLTVRYRSYFGGLQIEEKSLWAASSYGDVEPCTRGMKYFFAGEYDGHLRAHVVLRQVVYPFPVAN